MWLSGCVLVSLTIVGPSLTPAVSLTSVYDPQVLMCELDQVLELMLERRRLCGCVGPGDGE